jgi:hypothetical protein
MLKTNANKLQDFVVDEMASSVIGKSGYRVTLTGIPKILFGVG